MEDFMIIEKKLDIKSGIVPLIAALPYKIVFNSTENNVTDKVEYDPQSQRNIRTRDDYSTCRRDDSIDHFISTKSDTKRDD